MEASFLLNNTLEADSANTSESYLMPWYIEMLYGIAFSAMVFMAGGGNVIVIWIIISHRRMRTVTNYFLVNLAVSDTLITIFNTMFNFIYMSRGSWPFGRNYCKFTQFIVPQTLITSVLTFIAIAIDRYMVIVYPLKHRLRSKTVLIAIAGIWLLSILLSSPMAIYAEIEVSKEVNRTYCYIKDPFEKLEFEFWYNVFLFIFTYIFPLVVMACTYCKISVVLWGNQSIGEASVRHKSTIRSKRKIVKMMVLVVAIFAVCWLPQNLLLLFEEALQERMGHQSSLQHIYLLVYWLAMSNSIYNPIIYCWMSSNFRRGFCMVFQCPPCVHKGDKDTTQRANIFKLSTLDHTCVHLIKPPVNSTANNYIHQLVSKNS